MGFFTCSRSLEAALGLMELGIRCRQMDMVRSFCFGKILLQRQASRLRSSAEKSGYQPLASIEETVASISLHYF